MLPAQFSAMLNACALLIVMLLVALAPPRPAEAASIIRTANINAASAAVETKEPWGLLEALYGTSLIRSFNGTWITDEEFYYTASDKSIHKYNAATNTDSIFVTSSFLELYTGSTFTLSPDNTKILVRYAVEEVFRHSSIAKYDVFDIETRSTTNIGNGEKLQYCAWSTVKDRLSYVFENNVYIHYADGVERKITDSGVDGVIYNGVPDWVYEEEVLGSNNAMWWSPDSNRLAVGVFDDTKVQSFKYFIYGEPGSLETQYPKEYDLKYPKAGTTNPVVALQVFDLTDDVPTSIKLTAPVDIVTGDHIMQNVVWATTESLLITWMNRRQNVASIQLCNVLNGQCNAITRLEERSGWVDISTPKCLAGGRNCIFTNWIGNWMQVWNLDLATGRNIWASRGDFTVLSIYGYDEVNDKLYYRATLKGDPSIYHVFSNDVCLTCDLLDVDGVACRSASAYFSKAYSYYTVVCSGPTPGYTKIFDTKANSEVKEWELNTAYRARIDNKLLPTIRFLNVTLADGSAGIVKLKLPPNMNKAKKYPMIVYVYGGPNSVRVTNGFSLGFDAYMATNRSVIYAIIDGRGTGNKGRRLLFSVNNQLGAHEVEDQLFVTKYLQENLPYVDRERTGIWGWSYGGYVSAKTLANDTDRVFQCGISVAPVTSWLYYDSIYTERYMGLPTPNDNLRNYEDSSVLQRVENFRTHDFLLIHGSGDDNVHYQQTLMLSKVLQHNDIPFEQMVYTDENHSIGNFQSHLYTTMDHFWVNCLNLDVDGE